MGDIVEILNEVEEGWWRGALNGRVGVFPSNFVEAFDLGGSPKSANRKSITNSFNNGSLTKNRSSLNSSREDLDIGPPDAPSLPPKPGIKTSHFSHGMEYIITFSLYFQ